MMAIPNYENGRDDLDYCSSAFPSVEASTNRAQKCSSKRGSRAERSEVPSWQERLLQPAVVTYTAQDMAEILGPARASPAASREPTLARSGKSSVAGGRHVGH